MLFVDPFTEGCQSLCPQGSAACLNMSNPDCTCTCLYTHLCNWFPLKYQQPGKSKYIFWKMFCISEILAVYRYTLIGFKVTTSNMSCDLCCRPYATSVRTAFYLGGCHSTDMFKIGPVKILFGAGTSDTDIFQNSAKLM